MNIGQTTEEGRRRADLGDGTFRNPVLPGDHPDPSIVRVGEDYYLTCSSFHSYPGLVVHHSRNLLDWRPICAALLTNVGSVFAPDLVHHDGRFYIYFPAIGEGGMANYVVHADRIEGPWSEPVDLGIRGFIDPGHALGEDGKRYLFLNGVYRVQISDDGLSVIDEPVHVCHPWKYPQDWVVEMYAPEGPKILRRGGFFYMISAVGGTAGPPTSHMVVVSRSKSIHGPWEDCPANPVIKTRSAEEPWWSRGHATFFEGPDGRWWAVYHGYENGFWTLGRQTLLEPIRWTDDGWPEALGGDLSGPLEAPLLGNRASAGSGTGLRLSDDFRESRFGVQWQFHVSGPVDLERCRFGPNGMSMEGRGTTLADSIPMCMVAPDRRYEVEVSFELEGEAEAGLTLFYSERAFCGLGLTSGSEKEAGQLLVYGYGQEHPWLRAPAESRRCSMRIRNDEHILTLSYRFDERPWQKHAWQMEVSGFHHNVFGGFTSLKIGLFVCGPGRARFKDFRYRGPGLLTESTKACR